MNIHEVGLPDGSKGMAADVALTVSNDYPVDLTIPPLGFGVLVDNCAPTDPYIMVSDATIGEIHVAPNQDIHLNVSGIVRRLPDALTAACPHSNKSPLDAFIGDYIQGRDATIYVRGSDSPSPDTPQWITDLMSDITVPVPVAGHSFGNLIKDFSLADAHLHLPDFAAEPGTPEAQPALSAKVKVLVALPDEMNLPISVSRVRADADIFYHGKKLGNLNLRKWQNAKSKRIEAHGNQGPVLAVESAVDKAPLYITDEAVFTEVMQALLFGGKTVLLTIKAEADVEMKTAIGEFIVRRVPSEGVIPVKRGSS